MSSISEEQHTHLSINVQQDGEFPLDPLYIHVIGARILKGSIDENEQNEIYPIF